MSILRDSAFIRALSVRLLIVVAIGVFCPFAQAVTRTWDGGAGGTGTDLGTAANWSGDTLPSVATPDIAQWNGAPAGALSLVYSNSLLAGGAGNAGISLDVTSLQTGSLSIDSGVNTGAIRMNGFSIAASAGAVTLGNSANTFNLTLGGANGQTHTWTNNSPNTATINSDVVWGLGGGGAHTLALGGSGNWTFNNVMGQGTGTLSVTKSGIGTVKMAGANTYAGTTAVSAGVLNLSNQLALQNSVLTPLTGGVVFDSSIGGNAFTMGGLNGATGNNVVLENNAGSPAAIALTVGNNNNTASYAGTLSGAGSLVKTGTGTQTLTGANTYTGTTTINNGSLSLGGAAGALAASSSIAVNGASSTFNINRSNAVAQGTDFSGSAITGTGGVLQTGTGSTLTLNIANSYSGATTIGAGQNNAVLRTTATGALGSGTIQTDSGGNASQARLELLGGITLSNPAISFFARSNTSVGIQSISGNNTLSGNISLFAGGTTHTIQSDADLLTLSGTIGNNAGTGTRTLTLQGAGNGLITGVINNGGTGGKTAVTKGGIGIWALSGANSYSEITTVDAGTLIINGANSGAGTNATVNVGTLVLGNTSALGTASLIRMVGNNVSTLRLATDAATNVYDFTQGTTTNSTVVLDRATSGAGITHNLNTQAATNGVGGGQVTFVPGSNVTSGTAGISFAQFNLGAGTTQTTTLNPTASAGISSVVTIGSVTKANNTNVQTLDLGGTTNGNKITGVISNGASTGISLSKSNASTWTLSGNSTYTGATDVLGGTLLVNGNNSGATGDVTVNGATARLGGNGKIGGKTKLLAGTIGPGNSIGRLDFSSNLDLSGGTWEWEFSGGQPPAFNAPIGADIANVAGILTITTAATLSAIPAVNLGTYVVTGNKFIVFNYATAGASLEFNGLVDDTVVTIGGKQWVINYNDTDFALAKNFSQSGGFGNAVTVTAIPEASSLLTVGLGGIFAVASIWLGKRLGVATIKI